MINAMRRAERRSYLERVGGEVKGMVGGEVKGGLGEGLGME